MLLTVQSHRWVQRTLRGLTASLWLPWDQIVSILKQLPVADKIFTSIADRSQRKSWWLCLYLILTLTVVIPSNRLFLNWKCSRTTPVTGVPPWHSDCPKQCRWRGDLAGGTGVVVLCLAGIWSESWATLAVSCMMEIPRDGVAPGLQTLLPIVHCPREP